MPDLQLTCRVTGKPFLISEKEQAFLTKMGFPHPTLCPEERNRRRIVWRNEHRLYSRTCDLCQKNIVSFYAKESSFPIYCPQCFWSDKWDPHDHAREVDFGRPFFEQMKELIQVVPHLSLSQVNCENSDFCMNCTDNKNCYLISGGDYNEDCLYGINTQRSRDSVDHYLIYDSELCYSCLDCNHCYRCVACQDSEQCSDSWFLFDCKNCRHCAFSSNLRNKQFVLSNRQLDQATYEAELLKIKKQLFENSNWIEDGLKQVRESAVHPACRAIGSENVTGNNIIHCKDCECVFDAEDLQDCQHIYYALDCKDGQDLSCYGFKSELLYELISGAFCQNVAFSNFTVSCNNVYYSVFATNSNNLFGCVSMHAQNHHCILNKQYTEEEYFALRNQLVEHMKKTGEWGEFFPMHMSPFEYNRSMAMDHVPLSREEALQRGAQWFESVDSTPLGTEQAVMCTNCRRPFRLIKQELNFYAKMGAPSPKLCWPCRLRKLILARAPSQLFDRTCASCNTTIQSPFTLNHPEKVFCEECYLKTVY